MFKPIGPRIKVKIIRIEEKTAGGIYIPRAGTDEDAELGEVVAIGHTAYKDLTDETPWCKIGDKVLFQKYAGKIDPTEDKGSVFRYLKDIDIIAIETGE